MTVSFQPWIRWSTSEKNVDRVPYHTVMSPYPTVSSHQSCRLTYAERAGCYGSVTDTVVVAESCAPRLSVTTAVRVCSPAVREE